MRKRKRTKYMYKTSYGGKIGQEEKGDRKARRQESEKN